MLAGCVTVPDVRAPFLVSPDAALRSRAVVVANESALVETSRPSEWWRLFDDATLTALQAEAAEANLDIQAAGARIEESRAQLGCYELLNLSAFMIFKLSAFLCRMPIAGGRSP
jgi:outer membrane protein TolC